MRHPPEQAVDGGVIAAAAAMAADLVQACARAVRAPQGVIEACVGALLCGGHIIVEDVPGVGKTVLAKALAQASGCSYARVQCTSDLMPADVTGTAVWHQGEGVFRFHPGPVFANLVLVDEINRASPKTQSSLLEAMEEGQVTVDGTTRELPAPFLVIATQNPVEYEGTYPLPEAQLDRFMFNIPLDYPSYQEEIDVVKNTTGVQKSELKHILNDRQILDFQQLVRKIPVSDNVLEYAVSLATKTRPGTERATDKVNNYISWGAGPRASQYLVLGAKVNAAINGKYSPDIEDVRAIANYVLRHRIVRNYKAEAEGITEENIIQSLF